MISKEQFVRIICNIQEQRSKIQEFDDALRKLCDGYSIFDVDNMYLSSLLELLSMEMNDEEHHIEEWIFEDHKIKTHREKAHFRSCQAEREILLDSPEKLYDFLLES